MEDYDINLKKAAIHMRSIAPWVGLFFIGVTGVDFYDLIVTGTKPDFFLKSAVTFYYCCWVLGTTFDIDKQELVFVTMDANTLLKVKREGTLFAFAIGVSLCILLYYNTPVITASTIAILFICNICGHIFLIKNIFYKPFIDSENYYREKENYVRLKQLKIIYKNYLCGKWQWKRFFAGGCIVFLMVVVSFSSYIFGIEKIKSIPADWIVDILFVLFVAVMEIWIWYQRFYVGAYLKIIEEKQSA